MPEVPVKESRIPELRLPQIDRDEIVRALSDIKLPEVHVPDMDLSKVELPEIELPSSGDIKRAIDDAAVRVGLKERGPARWPFVLLGAAIVAGLAVFAVLSRPGLRSQLERGAQKARERIDEMRGAPTTVEVEPSDVASPVADSAWTDDRIAVPIEVPERPEGSAIPAFGESETSSRV